MTDDSKEPAREVYPGAPLRAVAIEIRFRRTLDAISRFGAFQRAHPEFPRVQVVDDDSDGDEAVLLLDGAGKRGVAISPTMLSLITYPYDAGYPDFLGWARPVIDAALDTLELDRFASVVYRYENVFDSGGPGFDKLLRVQIPRPATTSLGKALYLAWEETWPRGTISVDLMTTPQEPLHLHLDISARVEGPVDRAGLSEAIAESHRMARLEFEELITPEFREILRGGKP